MADFTAKHYVYPSGKPIIINQDHVHYVVYNDERGVNTVHFTNIEFIEVYQNDEATRLGLDV